MLNTEYNGILFLNTTGNVLRHGNDDKSFTLSTVDDRLKCREKKIETKKNHNNSYPMKRHLRKN